MKMHTIAVAVMSATAALVAAMGCGPTARAAGEASPVDGPLDTHVAIDAARDAAIDAPVCGQVSITFRDFHSTHADMQRAVGFDPGIVRVDLGLDNKPVYAASGATPTVSSAASFNEWYRDTAGVNVTFTQILPLTEFPTSTFTFDDQSFFPIDGLGYGNEGNPHNFHFTSEIHTTFTYHGGENFQFSGDDDVFVFVNKKRAIDLGGVHDPMIGTIDFDARQAELGITVGGTYQLDVFHAERHTVNSTFRMATTIECLIIL